MDPVTIGIIAVAAYLLVVHKPAPVMPTQGSGAGRPVPAPQQTPPPIPTPDAMVGPVLGGLADAGHNARNALDGVFVNVLGMARQRAVSLPTSPVDPAYPDQSSADASKSLMNRGLAPLVGIVSPGAAVVNAGADAAGRTRTGQALKGIAQRGAAEVTATVNATAADVVAAGGSVVQATQQAVNNAANTVAQGAQNADDATARFLSGNSPF